MLRNNQHSKIAIGIMLTILVASIYAILSIPKQTNANWVMVQDHLDNEKKIAYYGNMDMGYPYGILEYNHHSLQGIDEYKKYSELKGKELVSKEVKELYVWVTFRQALMPADFSQWVAKYQMQDIGYTIRVYGKDGARITMGGGPSEVELVPVDELETAMSQLQEKESNLAKLGGIFEVKGVVTAENYLALLADPRVYLVDVTGTLIYYHPDFQAQSDLTWEQFTQEFQMMRTDGSLYWFLEDFGIAKMGAD
ncbi:MAG TPA: hypothetical protein PK299_05920 [Anaerolineales bacterium]|nr:hypothetical protein [Anaerolineales bacterium]